MMNNDVTIELGQPENICIHHSHDEAGWRITLASTREKALKGARLKKVQKYISDETSSAFPKVKQGITEEVAIMLDPELEKTIALATIEKAAEYTELAEEILGYDSQR